jgi:hypothetical protein
MRLGGAGGSAKSLLVSHAAFVPVSVSSAQAAYVSPRSPGRIGLWRSVALQGRAVCWVSACSGYNSQSVKCPQLTRWRLGWTRPKQG